MKNSNNKIIKKVLAFIFAFCILSMQNLSVWANDTSSTSDSTFKGSVEMDKSKPENIFTGETKELKEGTNLKMTVSSVLDSTNNTENDEFFAEVTDDLTTEDGIVIPSGTIAHGTVTKIRKSRRLGRDAYINLHFDYLVTPDGRQIPVEASMTTKRSPAVSTAKVVMQDTAYTMAGGIIGGVIAFKVLGLGAAVASHGYTVAGGAGVGALIGATAALARKGHQVLISPGDQINVKIVSKLALPVMSENAFKQDETILNGLNVKITGYKLEKDPFGELNTITLTLNIDNKTDKTFSTFDMALVNDYKNVYYASPFDNTDLWFHKITPNSKIAGKISFSVDNPKRKHWLVFYDNSSRKPLAKISIDNAERQLKKNKEKKVIKT